MRHLPRSGIGVDGTWLSLRFRGACEIRVDLRIFDAVRRGERDSDVLLVCGDLEVALHVADGAGAVAALIDAAAPLVGRLAETSGPCIYLGDAPVRVAGGRLHVRSAAFELEHVAAYGRGREGPPDRR